MRKSAFSPKGPQSILLKQPKITCHNIIKSPWGQTRQLQKKWVQIELVEVCADGGSVDKYESWVSPT